MMGDPDQDDVLLTSREISSRVADFHATAAQITALQAKQEAAREWFGLVRKLIGNERAKVLIGDLGSAPAEPVERRARPRAGEVTWTSFIEDYVTSVNRPVDYAELREAVSKSVLAPKLESSDKSFYGAILKLNEKKVIIRKDGWVFSPAAFDEYQKKVASGEMEELPHGSAGHARGSRIGDAIMRFLAQHPEGVPARAIVEHMTSIEEFRGPIERNSTSVYNPLAKLVKRGQVVKNGTVYYPVVTGDENSGPRGDAAA